MLFPLSSCITETSLDASCALEAPQTELGALLPSGMPGADSLQSAACWGQDTRLSIFAAAPERRVVPHGSEEPENSYTKRAQGCPRQRCTGRPFILWGPGKRCGGYGRLYLLAQGHRHPRSPKPPTPRRPARRLTLALVTALSVYVRRLGVASPDGSLGRTAGAGQRGLTSYPSARRRLDYNIVAAHGSVPRLRPSRLQDETRCSLCRRSAGVECRAKDRMTRVKHDCLGDVKS